MELILARVFIRIIAFKQWLCSADILKLLQLQYMTYNINAIKSLFTLFVFIVLFV